MKELLPLERQVLLAKVYHFCWYSDEAFNEIQQFVSKWDKDCPVKANFFPNKDNWQKENEPNY